MGTARIPPGVPQERAAQKGARWVSQEVEVAPGRPPRAPEGHPGAPRGPPRSPRRPPRSPQRPTQEPTEGFPGAPRSTHRSPLGPPGPRGLRSYIFIEKCNFSWDIRHFLKWYMKKLDVFSTFLLRMSINPMFFSTFVVNV